MLEQYKCLIVSHNYKQIQGVCQNKYCKQPYRRICFQCIKDHQKNDLHFDFTDIKSEQEIQCIIDQFKQNNNDRINNILLQCQIQQYLLNIEMIEFVKLWNQKYSKINEILEELELFNNTEWININLQDYLAHEQKYIDIYDYLSQYQQKLLQIDNLKDDYIKNFITHKQYKDIDVKEDKNQLYCDIINTTNKQMKIIIQNITSNNVFKQKHLENEENIITIIELMLKQGYDLKTFTLFDKFQALQEQLLDKSIEKYKQLYIQSYAIAFKYKASSSMLADGLNSINKSLNLYGFSSKSYLIKGIFYYRDKNYEYSIRMYDEAINIDPKFAAAYRNKGKSFQKLQKYQSAIECYNEAIKLDSKYATAYSNKAKVLQILGKSKEAIEIYDEAIKLDPKNTTYTIENYDQAILLNPQYFNAFFNKGNFIYYFIFGLSLYNLQQFESAVEMYERAIKIDRKNIAAYINLGNTLKSLQKYKQAIEIYDRAIELDPEYPNCSIAQYNKGLSLNKLQQYQEAIEMFDKVIQSDPQDAAAYQNKGQSLYNLRQYEQAIELYDQAINIDPKNTTAYSNKGNSLMNLQKFDQAFEMYDQAIKIDPKYAPAFSNKGNLLKKLQKYQEAIEIYNEAIKLDPQDTLSIQNKAECTQILQNQKQKILEIQIELQNKYLVAEYIKKGNQLKNQQQYQKAIEMYDEAIKIDPADDVAYYNKGLSFDELKDYQKAIEMYDEAIKINPHLLITIKAHHLIAYKNMKKLLKCMIRQQKQILKKPTLITIKVCILIIKANSLQQLKQYNESIDYFKKFLDFEPNDLDAKQRIKKCFQMQMMK